MPIKTKEDYIEALIAEGYEGDHLEEEIKWAENFVKDFNNDWSCLIDVPPLPPVY